MQSSRQEKSKNISIKSTPYNDEEEKDDIDDDEDENKRRRSRFKSERTTEVVRKHKSDVIPDKLGGFSVFFGVFFCTNRKIMF